ncbi:hypothetical protein QBC40DRAFT_320377 [Triangularia verruculosa]|uniref:Uncharacterized protein n=1 Tax=Triangularia verruculosa TaxID=2587418 RepID=A0AAN6XRC6_9PEZI|nr:hypothetical protein QBC40DRAFT_320377 [Triangularia verruculosa]
MVVGCAQVFVSLLGQIGVVTCQSCPDYSSYSKTRHEPFSSGRYALSSARPPPLCRTFNSSALESLLSSVGDTIADPDLRRLFENTYPNTLDTAIKWHGFSSSNPDSEELTFIITGDINAMWLRDSANQLQSYLPLLSPSPDFNSLASLFRGAINLQARYLLTSPYCNSFQPPPESNLPPSPNPAADNDIVFPEYDPNKVFECKYELDSLASFLQLSTNYHEATHDSSFFSKFHWAKAAKTVLETAKNMTTPTLDPDTNRPLVPQPYTFTRKTTRSTETLANDGIGHPAAAGTGLVRSAFRPSDDSTTYQFLIPSNMLLCVYLASASLIAREINETSLADEMMAFSTPLRKAIQTHGIVSIPGDGENGTGERVYAYEVDGFGGYLLQDDANLPSLLSAAWFGYVSPFDPVYIGTRRRILSARNPYYSKGEVVGGVGSAHTGPGRVWPMSLVVRILTSEDDDEIKGALGELLGSTDGLGLVHESVDGWDAARWTREWFSWANGLFGGMILDLGRRKGGILGGSFQG